MINTHNDINEPWWIAQKEGQEPHYGKIVENTQVSTMRTIQTYANREDWVIDLGLLGVEI